MLILGFHPVFAADQTLTSGSYDKDETRTGIEFGETSKEIIKGEPKDKVYKVNISSSKPIGDKLLPNTGEMITSFIILLVGMSLIIIFIGVKSLQRIYFVDN